MPRIAPTVSTPCSRGEEKENSASSLSWKAAGICSQMPIVRSPCTFEWPRTGQRPAPGLPMSPRSSSRLTTSRSIATECLCWVSPIAQQTMLPFEAAHSSATFRICLRVSPVASSTSAQSSAAIASRYASKPCV